jgi:hypothetical protein
MLDMVSKREVARTKSLSQMWASNEVVEPFPTWARGIRGSMVRKEEKKLQNNRKNNQLTLDKGP